MESLSLLEVPKNFGARPEAFRGMRVNKILIFNDFSFFNLISYNEFGQLFYKLF